MNVLVALIRREYLEHRGAFLWSPFFVLALIVVLGLTISLGHGYVSMEMSGPDHTSSFEAQVDEDDEGGLGRIITALLLDVAGTTDQELSARMTALMSLIAMPFYVVLLVVSCFALIACFYDERKDRSVLFWKSMPVSDVQSVASKYVFVAWIAPLITIGFILASQVFSTLLLISMVEEGMGMRLLMHSGIVGSFVQIFFGYLVNGLVVLPVFAWFMLMSAWARSMPMVWALAVPFWLGVFESILFDSGVIRSFVGYHIGMPSLPGTSTQGEEPFLKVNVTSLFEQMAVLGQPRVWVGLVIGMLFLALCVYLRRTRNEI